MKLIKEESVISEKTTRLNREIRAPQVRVIGADGEQVGILGISDALRKAQDANLDLVEISPNAQPPVCRIMDYGKFLFEQNKQRAAAKKKQKQIQIKEIKFRPGTEEGDYQVKLRNLIRFLEQGDKVKITLRYRGRELTHQEVGFKLITQLKADLDPYGVVEQQPRLEGRQVVMVLAPKKK